MKNILLSISLLMFLITLPYITFSQVVTLGTAANFELFTTVGAITNTGISKVSGNVGSNSGAVTGFGNVNGVMQVPANGATGQAALDLNLALGQINSALPVIDIAPALGGGQILNAGVYHVEGVASLDGELFLDGQNNPDAVFIFQLDQAFSSGMGAKVKLINDAQACNVYWRANGLISLGDETYMQGNIIANNDALSLGVNDTLEGRAFAINGAITLNSVLAFIPTGCGVPLPLGPAAPVLGPLLACYSILSVTGDVTNTDITFVTGDIGTNAGATGGYDELKVTGTIHPSPDGSTASAAASMNTLYNTLNLQSPDIELLYPAQFGNDLVLTPHTYLMNAAASLTGNLYLNAQGEANAVFIIQINGALTAASLSRVNLVNGTQAKNVFWLVKGAATWGTLAVFNGIVVSTGAIGTATGDSINGRIFTKVGAITTQGSVITGDIVACGLLPLNLLSFYGTPGKNKVLLNWKTSNEINNKFFTIEKSIDGIVFETLTTVNAIQGAGNAGGNYYFTDMMPYTAGYYRISQTDLDGRRNYYKTIQVKLDGNHSTKIISYVRDNNVYIQTSAITSAGTGNLVLYSVEGRKIASQSIIINKEGNIYTVNKPSQKGVYIIKIISGEVLFETVKIVIN